MADIIDVLKKIAAQRRKEGKPMATPAQVKEHMQELRKKAKANA